MDSMDRLVQMVNERWGNILLSELRDEALEEPTGIKYESVRASIGPRMAIALCLTHEKDIAKCQRALGLSDAPSEDWSELTLLDLLEHAVRSSAIICKVDKDASGSIRAVAFIAADPDSVNRIESVFTF
ncbi:hypothetical protein H5P28_00210 [Ruficoccus amylovorans]|uniref:Uncharacterized protein n=1 Tax=Ruficoccus amylovorans TaxID=1804625 RepID=A0A842HAR4_9BACT|nr:hypothetical protein [Ruficoccus amylovorans]MBC2592674.1 hypothetical protein [Ruficoccus amylovorans]